ncbi:MAG: tetratricopeptide repeat protein [bacterium]|nr:tetratricopeptide repeat protein [bacterium]
MSPEGQPGDSRPTRGRTLLALALAAVAFVAAWGLERGAARDNPFARAPIQDAEVYWAWAADIAGGKLVGDEPFFSAPLYPYVLGAVRAVGGGIAAALLLQALLHAATVFCIARAAGARLGIIAGVLYLALADPLFHTGRLLPGTLQAFLVAFVFERAMTMRAAPSLARGAGLGLVYGIACLANPVLLAGLPLVAVWLAVRGGWRQSVLGTMLAVYAILPATIHNWRACGEPILVSAQGGLTFAHGNQAGAEGTYTPIDGVSTLRSEQNTDARARASEALGREATWRETSDHFRAQGLAFWREQPAAAAGLGATKLWLFLSGRHYGDIYVPTLERDAGLLDGLRFAPLRVAWLAPLALVAATVFAARRRGRGAVPGMFLLASLATCVVFYYSPRYRMPATPMISVLAAWGLVRVVSREPIRVAAACAFALALGLASGWINRALEIDDPQARRAHFEQLHGEVLVQQGDLVQARAAFERARALGHPGAEFGLADIERRAGDYSRAIETTRAETLVMPNDPLVWRAHAVTLALAGHPTEARTAFERVIELDPDDAEALTGLGAVTIELGSFDEGLDLYDRALAADPEFLLAAMNKAVALFQAERLAEAADTVLPVFARMPFDPTPRHLAADIAIRWATHPDPARRDGMAALGIAETLSPDHDSNDPRVLEALFMALAETATFPEARRLAARAAQILREQGENEWAADVERYAEAFARGESVRSGD